MNYLVALFMRITGVIGFWLYFTPKYHYENKKNNPKKLKSNMILISNHTSLANFVSFYGFFYFRIVRVLAAEVLYQKKGLKWLLKKIGCIEVNRNTSDLTFMNETINILNKGGVVGIFPEGRIPKKEEGIVEFKPSVIYLALKSNAPIVPMYMTGEYGFKKVNHTMIGEPIYISDYCKSEYPTSIEIKELSEMLRNKVIDLKRQLEEELKTKHTK